MTDDRRIGVLFICLGNICRSPLAEGVFLHHAHARGVSARFTVDSAGTGGWHAGDLADPRMRAVAAEHGVELVSRARAVHADDFRTFDHLLCMDEENHTVLRERGAPLDRLRLLLDVDPQAPRRDVPDPYYGGVDGFHTVYTLVDRACQALLDELLAADA